LLLLAAASSALSRASSFASSASTPVSFPLICTSNVEITAMAEPLP
jgi:hypothetical protein